MAIAPARVAQAIEAVGKDIYDRTDTTRNVLVLAAALAPGTRAGRWSTRPARSSAWSSPSPPTSRRLPTP